MGFDGIDENRFITPIEIPLYAYEAIEPAIFSVYKVEANYIGSPGIEEDIDYSDRAKLIPLLDILKGRTICFNPNMRIYDKDKEKPEEFGQAGLEYFDELNAKAKLSIGLLQLVPSNGIDYENLYNVEGDSSSIMKIDSIDDINDIKTENVLIIKGISCFIGED